jgi:hypothetical protein
MNDKLEVEIYEDGIKLSFNLTQFPEWQFHNLTQFIKNNREAGKIELCDVLLDKKNLIHLSIKGVEKNLVPEFLKMIECEILQSITPKFCMDKLFKPVY